MVAVEAMAERATVTHPVVTGDGRVENRGAGDDRYRAPTDDPTRSPEPAA